MTVTLVNKNGHYQALFRQGSRKTLRQLKRSLGTTDKRLAQQYQVTLQKLCDNGQIHPFDADFSIKEALNMVQATLQSNIMTLQYAIDLFLSDKKGLKTQHMYELELKNFMKFGPYTHYPIQRISSDLLSAYIWRDTNKGRKISSTTQNGYWRYLHAFFEFLYKKNLVPANPVKAVRKPKVMPVNKNVIATDTDIDKIFAAYDQYQADQQANNPNYRQWKQQLWFKPLIMLYNATGCRKTQPLSAKWQDIDADYSGIWLKGIKFEKADKVYYYIKYEQARTMLAKYKKVIAAKDEDYIFANPKTAAPISGRHVYKVFKFYAELAGVNPSLHIHGLRHKSVTDDLNSGVPIHMVSKQHQHSSIAITEKIYAHLDHKFVKDGYEAVYGKRKKE